MIKLERIRDKAQSCFGDYKTHVVLRDYKTHLFLENTCKNSEMAK